MNPLNEYNQRRDRWMTKNKHLEKRSIALGNWRLLIALCFALLAWLTWRGYLPSALWLLVPTAAFIALGIWHSRITRARALGQRAISYYDQALARLAGNWASVGNTGERFLDPQHVYAGDLDVFGRGSLFQLISTARTGIGESMLADWLLRPNSVHDVHYRQEAVVELAPKLDLREDLALLGEDVRAGVHIEKLRNWSLAPRVPFPSALRPLTFVLAVAGVFFILAFFAHLLPLWPFVAVLGCDFFLIALLRKRVAQVIASIETPGQDLALLSLVLARLERESFRTSRLQDLLSGIRTNEEPASKRIKKLQRWVATIDSSDHILIRAIRPVLLWQEQLAMGVEAWRAQSGVHISRWLRSVGEFEAISSLASLTFEHPTWTFPNFEDTPYAVFDGTGMRHPLLPCTKCVPNDVQLGGPENCDLLIVSGSNMSGKSTLLRSVGLNTVLAWAGAPVAAERLVASPLQIGASLRVVDSLQDNRSRFMAEITRLRSIVELTHQASPVLFLLDELLSGTNSHDRRIGASAIVRTLLSRGAIGLITTHDLALAELQTDLRAQAENVHFEDTIVDGQIEFDYQLRPGVVRRSNALELMRAVGLEV